MLQEGTRERANLKLTARQVSRHRFACSKRHAARCARTVLCARVKSAKRKKSGAQRKALRL
eukprot:2542095-Prymnesium_polylepis.1